jgi:hypothetical protein
MVWLWWRQHRADRAEGLAIRLYRKLRAVQRQLSESIDDAIIRLDTELGSGSGG